MFDQVIQHKYWNVNGIGIAVVAKEGGVKDCAVYLGASVRGAETEELAVEDAIRWGAKLSREEAYGMLPRLQQELQELGLTYRD